MPVVHEPKRAAYGDTSVAWEATVVQPERMVEGSAQAVVVDVAGPVVLDMSALVQVGPERADLEWQGEPGQRRRGLAMIRPQAGRYRVLVRIGDAVLEAGRLLVTKV